MKWVLLFVLIWPNGNSYSSHVPGYVDLDDCLVTKQVIVNMVPLVLRQPDYAVECLTEGARLCYRSQCI